jgi:hypothetical protein
MSETVGVLRGLQRALVTFWTEHETLAQVLLFADKAPDSAQYPFAIYRIVDAPDDWDSCTVLTRAWVAISVYGGGLDEVSDLADQVRTGLFDASLSIDAGTLLRCRPVGARRVYEAEKWRWDIDLSVWVDA